MNITVNHKGYVGILEIDLDGGVICGHARGIKDTIHFEADTVPLAVVAFQESVDDYLNMCKEQGKEPCVTDPSFEPDTIVIGNIEESNLADDIITDISDDFLRRQLSGAKDRRDFASAASIIASDRYGAGSAAAKAVLYILFHNGLDAATDFINDLEHHEE